MDELKQGGNPRAGKIVAVLVIAFFTIFLRRCVVKNEPKEISIIDKELKIDGSVASKGTLIIKGVIKGTIAGETIVIAQSGEVYAETKADSMTIGGKFEGDISATKELIILSTGNCTGKVECKNLTVENGGILNASVNYVDSGKGKHNNGKKADKDIEV
jgi:cytoskeletal protein CcmA (bactofilin family)